jgi:hypothetical protein
MTLKEGTKLGRYEIRSVIGVGGMGEAYRANSPMAHSNGRDKLKFVGHFPKNYERNHFH